MANTLICLISQASFLMGQQLQKLEQQFLDEGGLPRNFTGQEVRRGNTDEYTLYGIHR